MLLIWMVAGTQKEIVQVVFFFVRKWSVTVIRMLPQVSVFWSLTDQKKIFKEINTYACVCVYIYVYKHRYMKD